MFPILTTGDLIEFTMLGTHVIPMIAAPLPLIGSSHVIYGAGPRCVFGDELPVELLLPMPYIDAAYTVPGIGMITLELPPTNISIVEFDNGLPVLLSGVPFSATFDVESPALQPSVPPVPDANLSKSLLVTYIPIIPIYIA
jgi:hypothetical protein